MTNLEAFKAQYNAPDDYASLVLTNNGITPSLSDENTVSMAWAMYYKAWSEDIKRGKSSNSLSSAARSMMLKEAQRIFTANDVEVDVFAMPNQAVIHGEAW